VTGFGVLVDEIAGLGALVDEIATFDSQNPSKYQY